MSKKTIRWFALFILMFILQTTVVPVIAILGIKPDLLVLIIAFLAFKTDVIPAVFAGFFLGLAQDFYAPSLLGHNALAMTISGFFAGLFNEKVMRIDPLFQLALIVLVFIVHDAVFYSVQAFTSNTSLNTAGIQIVTQTLPRTFYSLFFACIPVIREFFFTSGGKRYQGYVVR